MSPVKSVVEDKSDIATSTSNSSTVYAPFRPQNTNGFRALYSESYRCASGLTTNAEMWDTIAIGTELKPTAFGIG